MVGMMFNPFRLTFFVYLYPPAFIDESVVDEFDSFSEWSREYTWEQDEWGGLKDVAAPPRETVRTGRGDCEDYALVAASTLCATDRHPIVLAFMFDTDAFAAHVVTVGPERIYSSGDITRYDTVQNECSVDDGLETWMADTRYDTVFTRTVRTTPF